MPDILPAVGSLLADEGTELLNTAVQYYNQKKLNRQAQSDTQENMKLAQKLNLQTLSDSYRYQVAGLRKAGINPAAMSVNATAQGVSAFSGSSGQAAKPQSNVPAALEASNALAQQESQIENTKANTELQKAEAELKRQEVENRKQEVSESVSRVDWNKASIKQLEQTVKNLSYEELLLSANYRREIDKDSLAGKFVVDEFKARAESSATQYEKDFWNGLYDEAADGSFTVGALEALRSWVSYNDEVGAFENNELARQVQSKVMSLQLDDNDVLYSLAHMAPASYRQTLASARDLIESAKFRKVARELQLPSEAAFLDQQKTTMKNNDFIGHINNGEYGQAALTQVPSLLHLAEEGAFLYLLRGRSVGASSSSAPLPYSSMNRRDVEKALELSRNEIKAFKQAKKSAENNKRLGELYREEKSLMERLKTFNSTDYSR